jgi:hypothetical protein
MATDFTNNEALLTHTIHFSPNGNTTVLHGGCQVSELQESWLLLYVDFLVKHRIDPMGCEFILPNGLVARVMKGGAKGVYAWTVTLP